MLGRLLVILGGLVAVALFAALIGPYFINWNDYKGTFEAEAEKILGQPVRVVGTASATLLPLPSLTFTQVQVGDTEGAPMMTVDKFDVTIELMPLIQGEIRVVSMKLDTPHIKVSVDDSGTVDWLLRTEASKALNPEKVVLEDVEIVNGSVDYIDGSSGIKFGLDQINANLQATSLTGPWKIAGTYRENGAPYQFDVATGKWAQDAIRVKTTIDPANQPFTLSADGSIGSGKGGLSYSGTYQLTQVVAATEDGKAGDGWHSEGAFNLSRDRLVVPKAVVSQGPPDRPASLAGSLVLSLGDQAKFTASVTARQLDLDRSLGKGPSEPVKVSLAAQSFITWLSGIPLPPVPGNISFSVPAIVVGGAIVQDVSFEASPEASGWQIDGFHAQLPGQATLDAAGTLTVGDRFGFGGQVHLAVAQPVGFASWWRGTRDVGAGRLLAPFDLAGRARIEMGRVSVDSMQVKLGDERIAGSFAWSGNGASGGKRLLETDLKASRLDFSQIKALTELIIGQDLADTGVLADSYSINVAADELSIGDVTMHDVTADAGFVDGTLKVNAILIGDIGGTRVNVKRGEIVDVFGNPKGQLDATLNAADVTGLARFLDRLMPNMPLTAWLNAAAPALSPAALDAKIEAPTRDGSASVRVALHGSANATTFDAGLDLKGPPASWRTDDLSLSLSLSSYDAMALARQTGLDPAEIEQAGSTKLDFSAKGVPGTGLTATLSGNFAGMEVGADGNLIVNAENVPSFKGSFRLKSADVTPLLTMARLQIPGVTAPTNIGLEGDLTTDGAAGEIAWRNGSVAGRQLGGRLKLVAGEGQPRLDGEVSIDSVDFGWLTSLAVGYPMLPGAGEAAWSDTPFEEPTFGGLAGTIAFDAGRLTVAAGYDVAKAKLAFGIGQDRAEFSLIAGEVAGGTVTGGLTVHNVGGNANVTGRLSLAGTNIEAVAWERGGRPVVTGTADLASTFEATGRSLAGLIASLTGGGTLALHNGSARYINPQAASLILKGADVGQQLGDQALADQFATYMDGGTLAFGDLSADFSIAAGTARLKGVAVDAGGLKMTGSAAVDLGKLAVSSDWTMTFDPGEAKVEGATPQAGLVFRGPLAAPVRSFDLLPLSSYINIRQEARLQEILSTQEAVRLEKERFTRERRKLKEDADRAEREAKEAAALRAAILARLASFHDDRETHGEELAAAQLASARASAAAVAKALAEKALAEKASADDAAKSATAAFEAAQSASADAVQAIADRQAGEVAAGQAVVKASADTAAAKAALDAAGQKADGAAAALAAAKREAEDKAKLLAEAEDAARQADAARAAAEAAVKSAGGSAGDAAGAVKEAKKQAEAKVSAAAAAKKAAEKAERDRAAASDAAAAASARKAEAEKKLADAKAAASSAAQAADDAAKAEEAAVKAAAEAGDKVTASNAALGAAQKASDEAEAARASAKDAAEAAGEAVKAAEAALAKARDDLVAKQGAAQSAAKLADDMTGAAAAASESAKAAHQRADGLKAPAEAAARAESEAAQKAEAAKAEADKAAAAAVEKAKLADAAEAKAQAAKEAVDAARKRADTAAADADKLKARVAELELDWKNKEAAQAALPTGSTALTEASAATMQASVSLSDARTEMQAAEAAAGKAADAASAAESEAKALAGAAAPLRTDADGLQKAADAAQTAASAAGAEAAKAKEASEAAAKELAAAEDEVGKADRAAATAAKAVDEARAGAAAAADAVKQAEAAIAPAEQALVSAKAGQTSAEATLATKSEAATTAATALQDATASRDLAAKAKADADADVKVDAGKVTEAAAAKEQAAAEVADAEAALASATADYEKATDALAEAKSVAEKAAAVLKSAEDAVAAANQAVTAAESAASGATSGEAAAKKRLADARAAAEQAAAGVKAAGAADDSAKSAVAEASAAADAAAAERDDAAKAVDEAAAGEAAARQAVEQARADRVAAEQAAEAADKALADAEAAAKAAGEIAAAKAKVAEGAVKAAATAAEIAGQELAIKLPKPAANAGAAEVKDGGAGDQGADSPSVAPAADVPLPPMPPPRPTPLTPVKPAKKAPALTPLNIVPQTVQ